MTVEFCGILKVDKRYAIIIALPCLCLILPSSEDEKDFDFIESIIRFFKASNYNMSFIRYSINRRIAWYFK
jgi:hypothetical protein